MNISNVTEIGDVYNPSESQICNGKKETEKLSLAKPTDRPDFEIVTDTSLIEQEEVTSVQARLDQWKSHAFF